MCFYVIVQCVHGENESGTQHIMPLTTLATHSINRPNKTQQCIQRTAHMEKERKKNERPKYVYNQFFQSDALS